MSFLKDLFSKNKRKLEYISNGRCGSVIYKDDQGDIKFYYEFGGGKCVAIIFVPPVNDWTVQTKRNLSERNEILTFVAEQTIKDQSPNSYFEISENSIEIFSE